MALSALVALLQYPCIALVNGVLNGDPFYVSARRSPWGSYSLWGAAPRGFRAPVLQRGGGKGLWMGGGLGLGLGGFLPQGGDGGTGLW